MAAGIEVICMNDEFWHRERQGNAVLHVPEKPTLKRLHAQHGEPPWTVELPDIDALPDEAVQFVSAVTWHGMRFERVVA